MRLILASVRRIHLLLSFARRCYELASDISLACFLFPFAQSCELRLVAKPADLHLILGGQSPKIPRYSPPSSGNLKLQVLGIVAKVSRAWSCDSFTEPGS
jgi:hypothetical protein